MSQPLSTARAQRRRRGSKPGALALVCAAMTLALAARAAAQDPRQSPSQPQGPSQSEEPQAAEQAERVRLRRIDVATRDVFAEQEARENVFYRLANWLHVTTREEVVWRELWFGPGDSVTKFELEELERNLRDMGLFGEVRAELLTVPAAEQAPDGVPQVDLLVDTRDRFSLEFSPAAAFVGGVTKFSATIAERNLLGSGKQAALAWRASDDDWSIYARWFDPQLAGSWYQLGVTVGTSEEGVFGAIDLVRPFKHLGDPLSHGVQLEVLEHEIDYYDRGDSVAQVPEERLAGRLFAARGFGPRHVRSALGFDVRARHSDFGPPEGIAAGTIRVPGDTREVSFGPFARLDWIDSFDRVVGLDTLDYVQDLQLGVSVDVRLAALHRAEDAQGGAPSRDEWQPLAEARLRGAARLAPHTWGTLELYGRQRWHAGETTGCRRAAALHLYNMSLPAQTLAASFSHDSVEERQGLLPQFTLGEDNGLRGYPARELAGTRVALLNVENRIRTPLEVLSVHLGVVAFWDVGWVYDEGQALAWSRGLQSAGFGLRLGSSNLFGDGVVRIDVAWPLDRYRGESYHVSVSTAVGQVFRFFGRSTELGGEF